MSGVCSAGVTPATVKFPQNAAVSPLKLNLHWLKLLSGASIPKATQETSRAGQNQPGQKALIRITSSALLGIRSIWGLGWHAYHF